MYEKLYPVEVMFTPDWHPSLSPILGDFKGEIGYITEYGTVHLIGKKDTEITKNQISSRTDGATKSITATKSAGFL